MKTRLLLTLLAATWASAVQAQAKPEGFLCCNMRTDPDTRMRVVLD